MLGVERGGSVVEFVVVAAGCGNIALRLEFGVATVGLVSKSSWQILPNSGFLDELNRAPLPPEVDYYTIAAQRDWVCPIGSTFLPGATRLTVPLGHSSLVVSEEVYRHVISALRK